jgi:uncharacterized membrane protein YkvA (DUF1232 family)
VSLIDKLKSRARQLKTDVAALYLASRHPNTPWYAKLFIAGIVAYALSPIDLIPDFIPVLGFLDEIVLLPLGITLALKMIPVNVIAECRARASTDTTNSTPAGRIGAVVIVLFWLTLIIVAGIWTHSAFARERGK